MLGIYFRHATVDQEMINRTSLYCTILMSAVCNLAFVIGKWPDSNASLQHSAILFCSLLLLPGPAIYFIGTKLNILGKWQKGRFGRSNWTEVLQILALWDLSSRFLSFYATLTIAEPTIGWLTSDLMQYSAPWWAAQIALYAQFIVLWVLLGAGLRSLLRLGEPVQTYDPLWRGAVCDLAIAGGFFSVSACVFVADLATTLPGGELALFFVFELAALAMFLMIRDARALRSAHDAFSVRA